jgi:hypothetical protein
MATLTVECVGNKWQDDFVPVVRRVESYYGAIFRSDRDREDRIAEAKSLIMEDFARRWSHGRTVRLRLRFRAIDVMRGATFASNHPRRRMAVIRSNRYKVLRLARGKIAAVVAEIDFRMALEKLTPRDRKIVLLLVAGHNLAGAARLANRGYRTVVAAARHCLALLGA